MRTTANESRNENNAVRALPNPKVSEKAQRRQFSTEYKVRILEEADRCTEPGQVGALLRREGLYASNLRDWRRLRRAGILSSLGAKKRGPKSNAKNPLVRRLAELEAHNQRLMRRLEKAEKIIEVQKKVSELLGIETQEDLSFGPS